MTSAAINTLLFDQDLCINCGMCLVVCPHGVFEAGEHTVRLAHAGDCMECGACMQNCVPKAIFVESGVGCATAMIYAALTGSKTPTCGCACSDSQNAES